MSFWKKCPLLAAVIVSGLVIEGAGVANGVKSGEIENPASWKQPALESVFIDLKQGVYPWSDRKKTAKVPVNLEYLRKPKKTDWIYRKPAGRRMLTGMQIIKTEPETKMRQA